MRDMRLSTLIARGGVSLILVVPSRVSVVSSRVIVTHIMWTRKRLESEAIVTNSHSIDCFSRMCCVYYPIKGGFLVSRTLQNFPKERPTPPSNDATNKGSTQTTVRKVTITLFIIFRQQKCRCNCNELLPGHNRVSETVF